MAAMGKVPRHEFVPVEVQPLAYANTPLPIGFDKTISQPFIVALMTDLLEVGAGDVVLEVGTGLGYRRNPSPSWRARFTASRSSRSSPSRPRWSATANVERNANGYHGWSEHALFDLGGDGGARPHSAAAHPPAQGRRPHGDPGRPARRPAARAGREAARRPPDHEGDPAGRFGSFSCCRGMATLIAGLRPRRVS